MKNIGIITWIGGGNYGTSLQAFALYQFLSEKGYKCTIVNAFNPDHFSIKPRIRCLLDIFGIQGIRERIRINKLSDSRKYIKLRKFIKDNFKQEFITSTSKYRRLLNKTDVFCVGSDQVWNAYYNFNPFNFLNFAQNNKRISYASSMGTNDFPEQYKDSIKDLLLKFDHISLREETGKQAVEKLTARNDIKTVLDPTFLLSSDKWKEIAKQAVIEMKLPQKFILCYFIGNNSNYVKQVKDLSEKLGINNILIIPLVENPIFYIEGATLYRYASIAEFVYLLNQATWICTDSFHATVLSISMEKNFSEFLRFKDADKDSQNSRIYDILDTFGLQNRLYSSNNYEWAQPINFTQSRSILQNLREDSMDWLINSIEH